MYRNKTPLMMLVMFGGFLPGCRNSPDFEEHKAPETREQKMEVTPEEVDSVEIAVPELERESTPALLLKENEGIYSYAKKFRIKRVEDEDAPRAYAYTDLEFLVSARDGSIPKSVEIKDIKIWMKIHGHGLGNYEPVIEQDANLSYRIYVKEIFFIMPGPWEINITLSVNGQHDYVEYPIEVIE